ncbi:glycosyltransferase 87 family protein [Micromonospora sp. LOL_013]|uniref:glycosyltransferase 87 family protein n=1 Tax=Micromonospora sp. LOL_013 TaxID=3345414 RepID=UPI003A8B89C0
MTLPRRATPAAGGDRPERRGAAAARRRRGPDLAGAGAGQPPTDSNWFWTGGLLDTDRVTGDPRTVLNQSLSGAVTRVLDEPRPGLPWLVIAVLVGAAGMTVAVRCARAGDELLAVLACAATGLLVSPVSWHHHWVWWVPALLVLGGDQRWCGRRSTILTAAAGWLVLAGSTSWVLASPGGWDLHFSGLGLIYSNLYVLLALGGLGLLGRRVRPDRTGPRRRAAAAVGPVEAAAPVICPMAPRPGRPARSRRR